MYQRDESPVIYTNISFTRDAVVAAGTKKGTNESERPKVSETSNGERTMGHISIRGTEDDDIGLLINRNTVGKDLGEQNRRRHRDVNSSFVCIDDAKNNWPGIRYLLCYLLICLGMKIVVDNGRGRMKNRWSDGMGWNRRGL